jgi:hypothetical protein
MSLKTQLSNLTSTIAGKLNDLNAAAEKKTNKQQDLLSTDINHYPSVPAVKSGLDATLADANAYTDTNMIDVVKDANYVHTDNNYTTAEKTKLAGLEGTKYRGQYTTLGDLQTANPSPAAGQYADVDGGAGQDVYRYIYDANDAAWVKQLGQSSSMTNEQVKTAYEANANTNAFTDDEKFKLIGVEAGATADMTDSEIKTAYENNANTNAFTDANVTELTTSYNHTSLTNNPHNVTKAQVGLGNVDNTSDINKPISSATQAGLDSKLAKGTYTGDAASLDTAITAIKTELETDYKLFSEEFPNYVTEFNATINY